jgi:Zn-dependent protease
MLNLNPPLFISLLFVLIIGFSVHEFSHAWVADYFGDDTPRFQGRLTLNPLAHLDVLGSLMLLFAGFGWAKPVQVNLYALERRSKAAPMLVALAGPVSNLLLALVGAIPLRLELVQPTVSFTTLLPTLYNLLLTFVYFNLVLMIFNLIPLFPLDGEKVLHYFLPYEGQRFMDNMRRYSIGPLLVVLWLLPFLGLRITDWLVTIPAGALLRWLL